jgi:hypothetical protein
LTGADRQLLEDRVEHFDLYPLRGTKARSYAIWLGGKMARDQLDELCAQLSGAAVRNQPFRTND